MATKTLVIVEWGEQKKLNVFTRNWVVSFYRHEPKNIEIKYLLLGPMRCGLMVFSVSVYCVLWNLMVRERVFTMDKKKNFYRVFALCMQNAKRGQQLLWRVYWSIIKPKGVYLTIQYFIRKQGKSTRYVDLHILNTLYGKIKDCFQLYARQFQSM